MKAKHTFLQWHYTRANESLFDLSPDDLYVYCLIVAGAP